MADVTPNEVIRALGFEPEVRRLRQHLDAWVADADPDMRPMLRLQFGGGSKFFRPLTVFACHRAVSDRPLPEAVLVAALAVELFHNVTLIIDDLVDNSPSRRGRPTQHTQYNPLTAWMVAGYIDAAATEMLLSAPFSEPAAEAPALPPAARGQPGAKDATSTTRLAPRGFDTRRAWPSIEAAGPVRFDLRLLAELKRRLAIAECVQWENRKDGALRGGCQRAGRLLGISDWRYLAREDTGSMFEVCACLGARTQRFRRLGRLLGMLYHGCDDVADVQALERLGGGGDADLDDGILTLPASLAIRRSDRVRDVYAKDRRTPAERDLLRRALVDELPHASRELDEIRQQVEREAQALNVRNRKQFADLIEQVRQLAPAT
jgi:geranylgeranyl pyrophosphate synthase